MYDLFAISTSTNSVIVPESGTMLSRYPCLPYMQQVQYAESRNTRQNFPNPHPEFQSSLHRSPARVCGKSLHRRPEIPKTQSWQRRWSREGGGDALNYSNFDYDTTSESSDGSSYSYTTPTDTSISSPSSNLFEVDPFSSNEPQIVIGHQEEDVVIDPQLFLDLDSCYGGMDEEAEEGRLASINLKRKCNSRELPICAQNVLEYSPYIDMSQELRDHLEVLEQRMVFSDSSYSDADLNRESISSFTTVTHFSSKGMEDHTLSDEAADSHGQTMDRERAAVGFPRLSHNGNCSKNCFSNVTPLTIKKKERKPTTSYKQENEKVASISIVEATLSFLRKPAKEEDDDSIRRIIRQPTWRSENSGMDIGLDNASHELPERKKFNHECGKTFYQNVQSVTAWVKTSTLETEPWCEVIDLEDYMEDTKT